MTEQLQKDTMKKQFRKLHIVQIQDKLGRLNMQDTKQKKTAQSFEQIDMLSITDHNSKFAGYNSKRGIIFLANKEKQDRLLKLYAIKLKKDVSDDTESEKHSDEESQDVFTQKLRFYFISEYRLQVGNNSFSAIQKVTQGTKSNVKAQPVYF